MPKRYYFTSETYFDGDDFGGMGEGDYIGNIRGARTVAQRMANRLQERVYINDCETEDIVESVEPNGEETPKKTCTEKTYKAFVTDRETGDKGIITFKACSKAHALHELRVNGYKVDRDKVKPEAVFDYIVEHTNCSPYDWKEIRSLPRT